MEVRVVRPHEAVRGEQGPIRVVAVQRPQVDHLARGEQILLPEPERRVGDDVVCAQRLASPQQLREQDDDDGGAPHVTPAGDDEDVDIAAGFEIEMRDAAGQREHAHVRQSRDEAEQQSVLGEERAAARFAFAPDVDQVHPPRRKEVAVALLHDVHEPVASANAANDFRRGLL
jgi:hypothetical protein